MLLASIIYHEDYLRNACPSHQIFTSRIFTMKDFVNGLKDKVLCGCRRNPVSGLIATG